ncbi:AAA family ATPase [Pseudovibrio sp. Alg231-02]|uniref:AAA family ATPase n=1 Tax=Pseudovibrio sp. Alg231-02 TaxID=1922223 RepID=UPI000D54F981|nr:ATP-binding protein [Pseudovibrio sp. Alg231-02]
MARGELMKKLLASYGQDDSFRAVAEEIIGEEERKNNRVLARTLRQTLETLGHSVKPKGLGTIIPFPDEVNDFVQRVEPRKSAQNILLSAENTRIFTGLLREYRKSEQIKMHGLPVRSKLLFCGPPGCGKTLCAEVFANELGLPLFVVKLDRLMSSYLGETATNIRKIFEFARRQPCVLFLDEFDAIARTREDIGEHSELRRVVNSLLLFIEQIQPSGFLLAATNLDRALDSAVWRRFDEVVWFDAPDERMTRKFLINAFKNVTTEFEPASLLDEVTGYSYAELEKISIQAIKLSILGHSRSVSEHNFHDAVNDAKRRKKRADRLAV